MLKGPILACNVLLKVTWRYGGSRYIKESSIMHGVIYETFNLILKCLWLQQNTWQKIEFMWAMLCNWWSVPVNIVKVPSTLQIVLIADNWKWHLIARAWCHLFLNVSELPSTKGLGCITNNGLIYHVISQICTSLTVV